LASNVLTIGYWTYKAFEMVLEPPFSFFARGLKGLNSSKKRIRSLKYKKHLFDPLFYDSQLERQEIVEIIRFVSVLARFPPLNTPRFRPETAVFASPGLLLGLDLISYYIGGPVEYGRYDEDDQYDLPGEVFQKPTGRKKKCKDPASSDEVQLVDEEE
jgi:hypothetical protein